MREFYLIVIDGSTYHLMIADLYILSDLLERSESKQARVIVCKTDFVGYAALFGPLSMSDKVTDPTRYE